MMRRSRRAGTSSTAGSAAVSRWYSSPTVRDGAATAVMAASVCGVGACHPNRRPGGRVVARERLGNRRRVGYPADMRTLILTPTLAVLLAAAAAPGEGPTPPQD